MSKLASEVDSAIQASSKNRCGYCLLPQILASYKLEIEHILPRSKGGKSNIENLCLACRNCNLVKASKVFGLDIVTGKKVVIFHPNLQHWSENFEWDKEKISIIGKTPCGCATVQALKLNDELHENAREVWKLTGLFPPED